MEPSPPPTSGPQLIWHYTLRQHYQSMLRDGAIKPATTYAPQAKRAAVWFTSHPDWDPIVSKAILCADETWRVLNRDELHTIGLEPMRLGVSARVAPLTWHDFKRASGNPPKVSSILVDAAAKCQSHPSNWFATFEPVPQSEWLAVEQWDGWRWVPV